MHTKAARAVALVTIVLLATLAAGCAGPSGEKAEGKMADIDAALGRGPVLVEFGATWCHWCELEKPVIGNLSAGFSGVNFVDVDVDEDSALANDFYVEGIPQMNIIVSKNKDGSYLYIDPRGQTTTDRYASRLVGYMEYDELRPLVEAAVAARTGS